MTTKQTLIALASGAAVLLAPVVTATTASADTALPLHDVASVDENTRAQQAFAAQLGVATATGGLVGGAIGAGIGCVVGLPAAGVGCIPGAVAGFGIGSVVGTIAVGGPTLIVAGIDLVNTMNAAPGTTPYATR